MTNSLIGFKNLTSTSQEDIESYLVPLNVSKITTLTITARASR